MDRLSLQLSPVSSEPHVALGSFGLSQIDSKYSPDSIESLSHVVLLRKPTSVNRRSLWIVIFGIHLLAISLHGCR